MEHRISATSLARNLGDVLARVRYRGESFIVERNGKRIARVSPLAVTMTVPLRVAFATWREGAGPDLGFASDLEAIGLADQAPANPWAS
jgi:antitoxin (DNA-binding transcriptional repressor) of toxin-antitoxin stability system